MSKNEAKLRLEWDTRYCITGSSADLHPSERQRLISGRNALSVETARVGREMSLNRIHADLSLGKIESFRAALEKRALADSEVERINHRIENGRLLLAEARWEEAVNDLQSLLGSDTPGVWRLTVHQLLANAYFELGSLSDSLRQIVDSRGLQEAYPHSPVVTYLAAIEAKCRLLLGDSHASTAALERLQAHPLFQTPDGILTDLRLHLVLGAIDGADFATLLRRGVASYRLALSMSDELYAGLALAEMRLVFKDRFPENCEAALAAAESRYERVRRLLEESARDTYFTAEILARCEPHGPLPGEGIFSAELLWIPSRKILLRFSDLSVLSLGTAASSDRFLQVIAERSEWEQDELFERIWGLRFSKERHKSTLAMALKRFRSSTGVNVVVEQGRVRFERVLRVD